MDSNSVLLGAPDNSENEIYDDELGTEEGEGEEEETPDQWIIRKLLEDILNFVCHDDDDDDELDVEEIYSRSSCTEISSGAETTKSSECIDMRLLNWKLWLYRHEAQIQSIIKKTRRPICDVLMANLDEVYRIFMIKQILKDAEEEKNWDVLFWKMPQQLKCIPNAPQVFAPFPTSETCNKPLEYIDLPTKDLCERRLRKKSWLMSKYLEEKLRKMDIALPNMEELEITGAHIKRPVKLNSTFESYLASTDTFLEQGEEEEVGVEELNVVEEIDCITFQLKANDLILCGRYNNIAINLSYETSELDRQVQSVIFQNVGRTAIRFNFKDINPPPPYEVFYCKRNNFKLIPQQICNFDVYFQPTEYGIFTEHIQIEMNSENSVTINLFGYCGIGIPEMRAEIEMLEMEMQNEISLAIVSSRLDKIIKKSDPCEYREKNYEIILTPEIRWNIKNPQFEYDLEIVHCYAQINSDICELPVNLKLCDKWDYDLEVLYAAILNIDDEEKRCEFYQRFCTTYNRMRSVKHGSITRNEQKIYKVRTLLVSLFNTFEKMAIDLRRTTNQSLFDDEEENVVVLHKCDLERETCESIEVNEDELNKTKYAMYLQSLHLKTYHLLYTAIDNIVNAIESTNIRN